MISGHLPDYAGADARSALLAAGAYARESFDDLIAVYDRKMSAAGQVAVKGRS